MLPLGTFDRAIGDLAEGLSGPQRPFLRGVLADAALPVVHRGRDFGHVSVGQCLLAGFGRGQLGVVAADGWGQDRDGILTVQGGRWPDAVAVGFESALPGDLRIGPGVVGL